MRVWHALCFLVSLSVGLADTLTLKSGRVINGTYLGGTAREVQMVVDEKIEKFDVGEISQIQFGGATSAPVSAPLPSLTREQGIVFRPDPEPVQASTPAAVEIPAGTAFTIRMIDAVDSEKNRVGETFRASMDEPVLVNGKTVVPRGADAVVKLVDDKESGKLTGRAELTLYLVSVKVNDRVVDLNTQTVTQASEGRGSGTAKAAGGGAALGAIIGAIAGGGKGAAIGAATGAGAGTAVRVLTKGQQVRIPSETRLSFALENAVRL